MRSTPSYFLCKWGVKVDQTKNFLVTFQSCCAWKFYMVAAFVETHLALHGPWVLAGSEAIHPIFSKYISGSFGGFEKIEWRCRDIVGRGWRFIA
jgi:hypothetical protein